MANSDIGSPPDDAGSRGDAEAKNKPKKRAARACLSCRARKVRCDVTLHGIPCMHCRLDFLECVVKPRSRKFQHALPQIAQRPAVDVSSQSPPQAASMAQPSVIAAQPSVIAAQPSVIAAQPSVIACEAQQLPEDTGREDSDNVVLDTTMDDMFLTYENVDDMLASNLLPDEQLLLPDLVRPPTPVSQAAAGPVTVTADACEDLLSFPASPRMPFVNASLYPMFEQTKLPEVPSHGARANLPDAFVLFSCYSFVASDMMWELPSDDVAFLERRGALHLPPRPMLNEFMAQFFRHVYPIMPLFDEGRFWQAYRNTGPPLPGQRRLPLFLVQAMLFISCTYVSPATLHRLGFPSVRKARTGFYRRAKALFDMDTSNDHLARSQTALMLTYHAPGIRDKTNTYWLTTAVHFARDANADQYMTMADDYAATGGGVPGGGQSYSRSELKRMWWCCILRDRIMSLGLRRPLTIRTTDFDFIMQQGLTERDFQDEIHGSKVYKAATKQVLAQLVVSLCELALSLGNALELLYPPINGGRLRTDDPALASRKLDACLADLNWWYEKTVAKFAIPSHIFGTDESLILFTNMLYIYYHTAKVSLCNNKVQLFVADADSQDAQQDSQLETHTELRVSLKGITDCLVELNRLGQIRYLPNTFVSFSALPFVWYILDAKLASKSRPASDNMHHELKIYADIMKRFHGLYENTDSMLQSINIIVNYIKRNDLLRLPGTPSSSLPAGAAAAARALTLAKSLPSSTSSGSGSDSGSTDVRGSGFGSLLAGKPQLYYRVIMTVEFFLSHDKLLPESDLPRPLRALHRDMTEGEHGSRAEETTDAFIYNCLYRALEAGAN